MIQASAFRVLCALQGGLCMFSPPSSIAQQVTPAQVWPALSVDLRYHLNFWGREKPLMWLKRCCSNKDGMLRGKDEANPQRHM